MIQAPDTLLVIPARKPNTATIGSHLVASSFVVMRKPQPATYTAVSAKNGTLKPHYIRQKYDLRTSILIGFAV